MDQGLSRADFQNPATFNCPIFECPADKAGAWNLQQGDEFTTRDGRSCYQAIGTTSLFNFYWFFQTTNHPRRDSTLTWEGGTRMFRRARMVYPSQFIGFFDDPFDATFCWRSRSPSRTHHGQPDLNSVSFLDGHAAQIKTEFNANGSIPEYNVPKYFLVFPEHLQ